VVAITLYTGRVLIHWPVLSGSGRNESDRGMHWSSIARKKETPQALMIPSIKAVMM